MKRNNSNFFAALSNDSDPVPRTTTASSAKKKGTTEGQAAPAQTTNGGKGGRKGSTSYAQASGPTTQTRPGGMPTQQVQKQPRKPRPDPYPGKSREDTMKFYMGDEPPPIKRERAHPVFYNYSSTASWEDYIAGVLSWVEHWWQKDKHAATEDCILEYVRDLRSSKYDRMKQVGDNIMAKMKERFSQRKYQLIECTCMINRNDVVECAVWLPTQQRPIKFLLPYFLKCWNDAVPKKHGLKSIERFTVYMEDFRESPTPTTSSDEGKKPAVPQDAVIINEANERASYNDILAEMGVTAEEAGLVFRQQWAIERYVRFTNQWYGATIEDLARKTASEDWGSGNWILRNLVNHTVVHQLRAGNVKEFKDEKNTSFFYLNINLIDQMSDPLYMCLSKYEDGKPPHYRFEGYAMAKEVPAKGIDLDAELPRPRWYGVEFSYSPHDRS